MNVINFIRQPSYAPDSKQQGKLPEAHAEDVEFSEALADEDDREAQQRAAEADRRAASYEGD